MQLGVPCLRLATWMPSPIKMLSTVYKNLSFLFSMIGNYRPFTGLFRCFSERYPHYAKDDSQICIEGFPRSGNTFLVAAIQRWNPEIKISHHSHLASNAKYALDNSVPTVILIREPLEAVSSAMIWDGRLSAEVGLRGYLSFYRSLMSDLPQVLVLGFAEFTQRPDKSVEKINQRFGLQLQWKEYDDRELRAVSRYLSKHDQRSNRGATSASLPNREKEQLKRACRIELEQCGKLKLAMDLYQTVLQFESVKTALSEKEKSTQARES